MAQPAPLAHWLDLDGHLGLRDDPFIGALIDRGRIVLPGDPGLSARPCPAGEISLEE